MQFFEIFIYSIIQGATEFLPVSSSAHLYLLQDVFNWTDKGLLYPLAAHFGTLLAVLLYKRREIILLLKKSLYFKNEANYILSISIAIFPVVFVGSIVGIFFNNIYNSILFVIGTSSIIGGFLLDFADKYNTKNKEKKKITYKIAFITGIFQMFALIPGMSRSGMVITALRLNSISRYESIKFSLFTGVPILIIASLYIIYKLTELNKTISYTFSIISFLSFIAAYFSIKFFISWVTHFSFRIFAFYRIVLGIFIYFYIFF